MAQPPRSNRRQFLQGEAAARALEHFADGFQAELPRQSFTNQHVQPLVRYARNAMAVEFQLFLNAQESAGHAALAIETLEMLEPLEEQMTVYRESSEVCNINRRAADEPVPVELRLFLLFQLTLQISRETAGAYDMTSGPLTKLWGFYQRQGRVPTNDEITATLQQVGYEHLELNATEQTIFFHAANMEINLGGIGKGYALDCMAQQLRAGELSNFLLHGGHSSVYAAGSRAGQQSSGGWLIGLTHPLKPGQRLCEFSLVDRALGTSGAGNLYFHHQGKRYGHILDPRTGYPAEGVLSCTVLAPTAAEADALSTAFYVGGVELARDYCSQRAEISALLVVPKHKAGDWEFVPINMPDWKILE